ncbi:trp-1 [Cordylochernes scorpioides]|uniref:Trp-1 n=1 Tax=Cordylochernes scorpioides TaxID=51811 RepID=A0ABY6KZT2_9ARAC|nr:trp-1 [Cordylochernes scorpioides]
MDDPAIEGQRSLPALDGRRPLTILLVTDIGGKSIKLSWELERLALQENEFKEIFQELSNQCKKYSCDLLDMCRSTEEVIAVLNRRGDGEDDDSHLTLARLKMALKYNQKQFVAHPNCQQLLTSEWYGGLPVWRGRNWVVKVLLCVSLITCIPLIALLYLLFPRSRIGLLIRSPFMKFIYHSASFGFFLMLLVLASTRTEGSERSRQNLRGPPLSIVEWLIFFWVVGMVWSECKQLWEEGFKAYLRQWWNWLDFIMLSLYLATFSLKAVAYLYTAERFGPRTLERGHWPNNDPTLVSEGVFAVANVFSFARIIYLFQTNPHLGPLQISLGCMVIDIAKFLFIFFLVLTSFACGLNQLYWYYDANTEYCEVRPDGRPVNCQRNHDAFMTIGNTFTTLFWSLFGIGNPKSTDLVEDDRFIETVGQGLFMSYHVAAIVVLINMLIAMMTKSFQVIEDHADREWKFARSKLWMSYFDEGSTMPPPFNIIISPKSVYYFFRGLYKLVTQCHRDIKEVMRRLVSRYIHQAKKQLRQGGVNEDDLLEIKQDISSLRYELREDRRNEAERNAAHMEALKQDLMHSHDWDAFKMEIVDAIRDEIKNLLQTHSPSLSSSVLYQTHLYTEF